MSNIYYWEKLTFSKLVGKANFLGKKLKKSTIFEEQKRTWYIRGNVYFGIIVFSCLSSTKLCLRFLWICFAREIKGFYQSSLGNEVDFRDITNVSLNILAKNQNFKNPRHGFVDERALITTLIFSTYNIFSTYSELSQNCTEKQVMPSKKINWLFNDICYLFTACFDWKNSLF